MVLLDGFELYEKLSRIDDTVKVCFLTAYDMDYFEKFKERFPHVPTRCFINQKPIPMKNLVGTVRTELGISQPKDNLNSSSQSASLLSLSLSLIIIKCVPAVTLLLF